MADPTNVAWPFQILRSVDDVRRWVDSDPEGRSIGFVPTMGCLHDGHLQLVRHSLSATTRTIVSIFINPTQFGPSEDLDSYPSTLQADLTALAQLAITPHSLEIPTVFDGTGSVEHTHQPASPTQPAHTVSAVFLPTKEVIYPSGTETGTVVDVRALADVLEGARRPGFFRGVATVVLKLFMIVEPRVAFFGQKDLHQALLLRRLASDLHLRRPRALIIIPTIRDQPLAMSSRNTYLSSLECEQAGCLFTGLSAAAQHIRQSTERTTFEELAQIVKQHVREPIVLDFFSLNDPETFENLDSVAPHQPVALSGAILVGSRPVRLLDNLVLGYNLNHGVPPF
ncbi:hypothetical protein CROQUDRAFT_58314 [Cronartium quercuum f. sp. fusiforme G11]|uniref:Pantoate--beta-alanine ligase n=1 Tax=Cronartium quercuum f. sp. fusiforme G11 TaxID=708437 RepID=A0A9P6NU65_9BASI|nr:hypothetical protein CROQUDRAFT_58314 [Cronartium quercuum f. sp. fusiforme G11]